LDDQESESTKYSTDTGQTFDHLVALKAQRQRQRSADRIAWLNAYAGLTRCEREEVDRRFSEAFAKIASQFGKSRPLTFDKDS